MENTKQKIILIDVIDPRTDKKEAEKRMIESENLINTYWGFVIIKKVQKKQIPDYGTFVWKGKLEELKQDAIENWVKLIVINNHLKPRQLFNIEQLFEKDKIKIWTRTDLILKIFEKHAITTESRLQIELAAIKHMWPRIYWMWMELSRQGWWIWTSWIWETNTERMKRHLAEQERKIRDKLKEIAKRHELHRKSRERKDFKTVAIVWYTNAGKSELLRSLTKKNVIVRDELFATLDTRIWKMYLSWSGKECLVSDTIWFIQDLPPDMIDAFKSTLDETIHADLLLHVVDYSDPDKEHKIKVVNEILEQLEMIDKPILMVCNKIDLLDEVKIKSFERKYKKYNPTFISALRKKNLIDLWYKINEKLYPNIVR